MGSRRGVTTKMERCTRRETVTPSSLSCYPRPVSLGPWKKKRGRGKTGRVAPRAAHCGRVAAGAG